MFRKTELCSGSPKMKFSKSCALVYWFPCGLKEFEYQSRETKSKQQTNNKNTELNTTNSLTTFLGSFQRLGPENFFWVVLYPNSLAVAQMEASTQKRNSWKLSFWETTGS